MRRPLFLVCLCLIVILALRDATCSAQGISSGGDQRTIASVGLAQRGEVTVTGRVYQKDTQYFYLDSIIIHQAENLQQHIPVTDFFLVEQQEWEQGLEPHLGSTVIVRGTFQSFLKATNPGEFDAETYYRSMQIGGKLVDVRVLAQSEEYSRLREMLFQLRKYWENRLYMIFPEKEASIMATILLGEKAGLDSEIRELYQRNGIVHILSISGLHITIIGMGIYKLLRRIGVPPWLAAVCGGGILLLYGMMTGMGISVCRAIGMYFLRMLAELVGRTYDLLTALGLVGVIMLWKHPGYLHHSGFWLSYMSVLGVGVTYPAAWVLWESGKVQKIHRYEENQWKLFCREQGQKWCDGLIRSMLAGLSITLTTLPVQLWFYYEVPTYSVLLNLLILPFMSVLMVAGMAAMLVPGLGIVGTADWVILTGYEKLCNLFDKLPFHTWNPGKPAWWQMVVYYVLLFSVVWLAGCRKKEKVCRRVLCRKILRPVVLVGILTMLVGVMAIQLPQGNVVTFLDVGQGDGICLRTVSGEVYLFDGGSSSRSQVGRYVLEPYLKYYGLSHVNAILVSHPDADHCNGILELVQNCENWGVTIDQLILPAVGWQTASESGEENPFGEILEAAARVKGHPIEVFYVQAGDRWQSGEVLFQCLHPSKAAEDIALWAKDTNAASECFYVSFGANSLLLTGDVQGEGEKRLMEELERCGVDDVTVLKVAHHGSRNSTPQEFLEQVSPRVAVISSGKNNRYGHPHEELVERLEEAKAMIFKTAESGAITVRFVGERAEVYTFR